MSEYRFRRIRRRTAERLLGGDPAAGDRALGDLLSAAAAPARDGELDGENAAVMAFRSAGLEPVPQLRRRSMIKTTLAKLLTAKLAVAAAATAAVTVGGVAVVSATSNLPASHDGPASVATTTTSTTTDAASVKAGEESSEARSSESAKGDDHDATPSPSLVGLCHAYTAGAGSDHGKALDNPAFTVLITTAGGKDKVDAYCTTLLAEPHGQPSETRSEGSPDTSAANHSDAHSTDAPSAAHATGEPSTRPSH